MINLSRLSVKSDTQIFSQEKQCTRNLRTIPLSRFSKLLKWLDIRKCGKNESLIPLIKIIGIRFIRNHLKLQFKEIYFPS